MCTLGDMPRMYRETTRVAQKEHTCCECGSTIDVGETYVECCGLWTHANGWHTFRQCEFCADISRSAHMLLDLNSDECIPFGQLWECIGYDF